MSALKTIIAGTRSFADWEVFATAMSEIVPKHLAICEVVSGCAQGADTLGERWAVENGIPLAKFPAHWDEFGRRAGVIRNAEMAEYAGACIVFWNGKSPGTRHMIRLAVLQSLPTWVVDYPARQIRRPFWRVDRIYVPQMNV